MSTPENLRYCSTHEWVRTEDDGTLTIGITEYAQEQLGDVVFAETPEVDLKCTAEQAIAVVESVKAASDIYAPVAGVILDTNHLLGDTPELINTSPYADGWLYKMKPDDESDVESLMDAEAYSAQIAAE